MLMGPRPGWSQVWLWSRLADRNRTLDLEFYISVVGRLHLKYANILQLIVSCICGWMPLLYSDICGAMWFPGEQKGEHKKGNRRSTHNTALRKRTVLLTIKLVPAVSFSYLPFVHSSNLASHLKPSLLDQLSSGTMYLFSWRLIRF